MLTKYYKQLSQEQQTVADQKIALRLQVHHNIVHKIMVQMNSLLDIEMNKVTLYKNTLMRIEKEVRMQKR
ncbi:hypothetical protein M0D21_07920 [Aquimarina sp. D1M17]|uniref:hypothetical protein n=1 Tax=Aquimarina acroporae TaxID=2937283 RepID=UPI0020BD8FCF|nr:hypothetical protein [Aquimarina acroporae]MCK8521490.1 hypothetical protein [Aquimarina acroporae]